jgi:hypothetical protein
MKSQIRVGALVLAAALALAGCLDTSVKVTVKPDGSGTVEKTILVSKALVEFMKGMGSQGDDAAVLNSLIDEKSLKAQAAKMGSGVAFVSAVKISTDKGNGYKASYTFKDITKVKIDQNPSGDLSLPSASSGQSQQAPQEFLTFGFTKGSPALLTIALPQPTKDAEAKAKAAQTQAAGADAQKMMETLKPLYENLRIAVFVEVQGKIVETNAANVKGSSITIMDVDFGKVLADDAMFKKLSSGQQSTLGDTKELLKDFPGIVFETAVTVRVKFQ